MSYMERNLCVHGIVSCIRCAINVCLTFVFKWVDSTIIFHFTLDPHISYDWIFSPTRKREKSRNFEHFTENCLMSLMFCVAKKVPKFLLYKLKSSTYGIRRYTLLFRIYVFAYVFQKMICITYTNTHHTPHSTLHRWKQQRRKNGSIHINNLILNACWTEK